MTVNPFFPSFSVVMELVLHPIVMAMAKEKLHNIATGCGVHTVAAMATKGIEFFSIFCYHYHHSVNEPLDVQNQDTDCRILCTFNCLDV